jgi:hypothetical protein
VNAHQLFRLSLEEIIRRTKRNDIFRHPSFACAELFDPLDEANPFVMQAPLPEIEREWHFRRDAVPEWIRLFVGRAARERTLKNLEAEYNDLEPSERFKRAEDAFRIARYSVTDPETWNTPFFCFISVAAAFSGIGIPLIWVGNRSTALTDPKIRPWFFDERAKVVHGEEATLLARLASSKAGRAP